jgi:hypothetical protein
MALALVPPARPLVRLVRRRTTAWSASSAQQARRNALVASTALAQRTAERREVEAFLAGLAASSAEDAKRVTEHAAG